MAGVTYDTGVLIAAERGDRRVWALHRRALERGSAPTVPVGVLVEAWRGRPELSRLLSGCAVEALTEQPARAAGELLAGCSLDVGAVDASVVEGALRRADVVVTSNRAHLAALADGARKGLDIIDV